MAIIPQHGGQLNERGMTMAKAIKVTEMTMALGALSQIAQNEGTTGNARSQLVDFFKHAATNSEGKDRAKACLEQAILAGLCVKIVNAEGKNYDKTGNIVRSLKTAFTAAFPSSLPITLTTKGRGDNRTVNCNWAEPAKEEDASAKFAKRVVNLLSDAGFSEMESATIQDRICKMFATTLASAEKAKAQADKLKQSARASLVSANVATLEAQLKAARAELATSTPAKAKAKAKAKVQKVEEAKETMVAVN
jgi:hypothetical protein